jgi:hypothetical protein
MCLMSIDRRRARSQGDTEYTNFSVRCRNFVGWSPPSNVLATIRTLAPVAPSAPLFFEQEGEASSSTIALSWTPPEDDGGAEIVDYQIDFVEVCVRFRSEFRSAKSGTPVSESSPNPVRIQ